MIIDLLLELMMGLFTPFLALRPEWDITLPSFLETFVEQIGLWNSYFPIMEVLTCLSLTCSYVMAAHGFKWIIKLLDYIADVIP